MSVFKQMLLASAAGVVACGGTQAADLPSRKAAPSEYVRICDAYGSGFFFIPGSNTCLKVGGRVRVELDYNPTTSIAGVVANAFPTAARDGAGLYRYQFAPSYQSRGPSEDKYGYLVRGILNLDARTETDFGTVRTFIGARHQNVSGLYADNGLRGVVTGQTGNTNVAIENAFVQFAGFTVGRGGENFGFQPPYNYISHFWASFPAGINQLTYTQVLPNGFSATVSLEDRAVLGVSTDPSGLYRQFGTTITPAGGTTAGFATGYTAGSVAVANGPQKLPAIVGLIRVDQAWGAAQIMGALERNGAIVTGSALYASAGSALNPIVPGALGPATSSINGVIEKTGFAVGAGLKVNLPMIAAGDVVHLTGAYSVGALDFIQGTGTSSHPPSGGIDLSGFQRTERDLYVFPTTVCPAANPGVNNPQVCGISAEQTTAWQVAGIYTHFWSPMIRQNLLISYINITPGKLTRNTDWIYGGLSKADGYQIGTSVVFTPTRNFDIGLEVTYVKLNQSLAHFPGAAPTAVYASANPAAGGGVTTNTGIPFKVSPNVVETRMRIERTF